jgi:Abortive infection alpha
MTVQIDNPDSQELQDMAAEPGTEPSPREDPIEAPTPDDPSPAATGPTTGQTVQRRAETAIETVPAIARVAAGAWLRVAVRGLETSLLLSGKLARAATNPEAAAALVEDVSAGLRAYAREFLGIADLDDRVHQLAPGPRDRRGARADEALREQGRELLRQAADVNFDQEAHPAYARILSELVPDEGRVLRLLAISGPQPSVDVRASNLIGVGSQLIAPGLNMIGAQGGLRHRDRVAAYLNNLFRLGLMSFSEEPLEDPIAYQVLEAQPEVMKAVKDTTRAKTVRRSVRLTPFGEDFCRVCLPLEDAADTSADAPVQLTAGDSDSASSQNGRPPEANGHTSISPG